MKEIKAFLWMIIAVAITVLLLVFFATLVNSEIKLSDISLFISLPMGTIIGTAFYALEKIKDNHKDD